ncbi:MLO-like protein 11 [Carex littledalei]|uniref:MLO-like protein 11 n=1 Tax=Carex littledalei TaxID=544730 RepID=A0A833VU47_9POAL|nr:MLO-like protein 11 [Carex littledalei]
MHGWGKAARKRRKHRRGLDESTIRTETSTVCSLDEGDQELFDEGTNNRPRFVEIELQESKPKNRFSTASSARTVNSTNGSGVPLLQSSSSLPTSPSVSNHEANGISRSNSMPSWERNDY